MLEQRVSRTASRRNETRHPTDAQERALTALLSGSRHTEAAAAAGVSRSTVWRWTTEDVVFRAEWNRRRSELVRETEQTLREVTSLALRAIRGAIEAETDRGIATTALHFLRLVNIESMTSSLSAAVTPESVMSADTKGRQFEELLGLYESTPLPQ